MFMSKPEHFLIMARPMRPVPMIAIVLPVTSSPRNGRNGCHDGHFCSRTRRSLGRIADARCGKNTQAPFVVRRHLERDRTIRLGCQARPAALFLKGMFETLANTRADEPATIHDARRRCGNIFEAISPIQATVPYQGRLFSVGTRRSPIT